MCHFLAESSDQSVFKVLCIIIKVADRRALFRRETEQWITENNIKGCFFPHIVL